MKGSSRSLWLQGSGVLFIGLWTRSQSSHVPYQRELMTIGALIFRIRFWGPLYCNYNNKIKVPILLSIWLEAVFRTKPEFLRLLY